MLNPARDPPPAQPPPAQGEKEEQKQPQAAVAADSLWLVKLQGKTNFQEFFSGSGHASEACAEGGMAVGEPLDLTHGHDLATPKGQKYAWDMITNQQPDVIYIGIPCTPWSQMQNINDPREVERKRKEALPLLRFCLAVAIHQVKHGR